MYQLMELTVASGTGLVQGEARWMDDRTLTFWCPEQLDPDEDYRVRVDLGAMGESVDVRVRVRRCMAVRSKRGGQGFLHGGVWEPIEAGDLPRLLAALTQTNPAWARRTGRAGPDTPSVTSQPSVSSVLLDHRSSREETSQALREALRHKRDKHEQRGTALRGLPVHVSVLGSISPRVIARFARSAVPGRYFALEPDGGVSCRLPCQQDLRPGESARITLGLPGRRVVRGRGVVRAAGRTWVDLTLEVTPADRAYLVELIEAVGGEDEAASRPRPAAAVPRSPPAAPPEPIPLQPRSAALPTAEVSASGPPSIFVGYESWSAVEESVDYDGRGLRFILRDPDGRWGWREVMVLFALPGALFLQFPARAVRAGGTVTVVSSRLPAGQALIQLLQRARRGTGEPAPLAWR